MYKWLLFCTGVKLGLTMTTGRRLRVCENRVFKKDIWFEKEATEAGELGSTGKKQNTLRALVEKPEGHGPLGKT